MDSPSLRVLSLAGAAWFTGFVCAALAAWSLGRVERQRCPSVRQLVERARAALEPGERRPELIRAEVSELAADAERSLTLATLLGRSLARVSLASGTALALLVFASGLDAARGASVLAAFGAFVGGAAGSVTSALFGRQARERGRSVRSEWRAALRELGRSGIEP